MILKPCSWRKIRPCQVKWMVELVLAPDSVLPACPNPKVVEKMVAMELEVRKRNFVDARAPRQVA